MIYGLFAIIAAAFAIWAMVMVAQSSMTGGQKVLWFILVILFPIVGPVIFYFMKMK